MFLKGSYWKVEFVRKSFLEQPSVLENVYCLHYSFFKGKGQKILRVYACSMLLLILMLLLHKGHIFVDFWDCTYLFLRVGGGV